MTYAIVSNAEVLLNLDPLHFYPYSQESWLILAASPGVYYAYTTEFMLISLFVLIVSIYIYLVS